MTKKPILILLTCLLALVAGALYAFGEHRWKLATAALRGTLDTSGSAANSVPMRPSHYDPHELEGLPAPVQRYFRAALQPGQPIIAAATVDMAGRFNMSATGEQWKPFTSRQRIVTRRAGFLWEARIAMLPGVPPPSCAAGTCSAQTRS